MLNFIKDVINHFFASNTSRNGAAISYFSIFSLVPTIVLFLYFLDFFIGDYNSSMEIQKYLKEILGKESLAQINNLIATEEIKKKSTHILSFMTLFFGSSGVLIQMQKSFNEALNANEKVKNSILNYLFKHLRALLVIISIFSIMIASTIISVLLTNNLDKTHIDFKILYIIEHFLSFFLLSISFSIIFKYMNEANLNNKVIIYGGIFTAILFSLGKVLISIYLKLYNVDSSFGSASMIVSIMLWVYYIAQIMLLGISFMKILSERKGY